MFQYFSIFLHLFYHAIIFLFFSFQMNGLLRKKKKRPWTARISCSRTMICPHSSSVYRYNSEKRCFRIFFFISIFFSYSSYSSPKSDYLFLQYHYFTIIPCILLFFFFFLIYLGGAIWARRNDIRT